MTYSEFGRRAEDNHSFGTDHGTAAPHFMMGGAIKGGFYGEHPDLLSGLLPGLDRIERVKHERRYKPTQRAARRPNQRLGEFRWVGHRPASHRPRRLVDPMSNLAKTTLALYPTIGASRSATELGGPKPRPGLRGRRRRRPGCTHSTGTGTGERRQTSHSLMLVSTLLDLLE